MIEEYNQEIFYIWGPNNVVADVIHMLPKIDDVDEKQMFFRKAKNLYA